MRQRGHEGVGFLLVGAGRGGTSLLAGLLDAHSRLAVGFEHQSVATLMGEGLPDRSPAMFATRVEAFLRAGRKESARFPSLLWGNKITTEQILGLEDHNLENPDQSVDVLDAFFNEALAGIPVVFLLRDGRTCVRSKVARTGQSVTQACERWKFSVEVWRFLGSRHLNNLRIRFEDLLADPRDTLDLVCEFLDVPWEDSMLDGTNSAKMLPEYRRDAVDATRLHLDDIPAECEDLIGAELVECGYGEQADRRPAEAGDE